ncbi:MAG: 4-hydroxybenzoate octaprenyltransferase [SAR202 cluster bacterium]|nr:4-hydroxybenzoate octaprenyltransferase [SAR202 cluster bacterium]
MTSDAASTPVLRRLLRFLDAIKFQETVFALPFAYSGMVLAGRGLPGWDPFLWITVAMVGARTLGMAANRLIDRRIDAGNPRTAKRHLPQGTLKTADMAALCAVAAVVFLLAAWRLNTLALALAPVAAGFLILYPFTKRFTWAASFFLGWALAIAPSAAWIGVTGSLAWQPVLLSCAVACWAASFDILYHAQDFDYYTKNGLHSVSQQFGVRAAFRTARVLDVVALACLVALGVWMGLAFPYFVSCVVAAAFMVYKHSLVSPVDMSRVGVAFFRINAYVSLTMFLGTLISVLAFQ